MWKIVLNRLLGPIKAYLLHRAVSELEQEIVDEHKRRSATNRDIEELYKEAFAFLGVEPTPTLPPPAAPAPAK
jgi:hypothetical protein